MTIDTTTKVYNTVKRLFKKGVELPISKIAKVVKMSDEGVRRHIVLLTSKKKIKRVNGRIVNVI